MEAARKKWNERYAIAHVPNQVIDVLELNQHLLSGQGISLDIACGLGGNALKLAEMGYESHAWDISDRAIEKVQEFAQERQLTVFAKQCDVSQELLMKESFDVIIVSRFLIRDMVAPIIAALKPGGLLFYQTFTQEIILQNNEQPENGPQNHHYRLEINELLNLFSGLRLRFYREDGLLADGSKGIPDEAMLVAQKVS